MFDAWIELLRIRFFNCDRSSSSENFDLSEEKHARRIRHNNATTSWILKNAFIMLLLVNSPTPTSSKRLLRAYDACYTSDGSPQQCRPDFQNIALKRKVRVSETCGVPDSEEFCQLVFRGKRIERTCDVCEASGAKSHPASHLTDINDMENITFWQSRTFRNRGRRDRVTLLISFGKSYELSYISLQFQSPRPAAMIIYKSRNNRRTWQPYQFYARSCRHRFGLENQAFVNGTNEQEALCSESSSDPLPFSGGRVLFNPTRGRPSEDSFESSFILQDWVTATDIKIVLLGVNDVSAPQFGFTKRRSVGVKNLPRPSRRNAGHSSRNGGKRNPAGKSRADKSAHSEHGGLSQFPIRKGSRRSAPAKAVYTNSPTSVDQYGLGVTPFYAINDIAIGARCKCNGHASTCSVKKGRLVCDCKHNTDGPNCERCKAFHFDRPWKRGTASNANECVACKCNLHAKKCRFNADLFEKSGGTSGGVCQKCRHHTTGRFCHFCKPGYYRNPKVKSIANRRICKTCGCHPVGAAGKICDPATGQCPCKDGVTGKKCNRCAKGYEQTRSRVAPCIKIPSLHPSSSQPCPSCNRAKSIQLTVSKWCRFDYIMETEVVEMVPVGKWVRATLKLLRVYRRTDGKLRKGLVDVRIREHFIRCNCVKLKKNRKYLLLAKKASVGADSQIVIDKNTIALRWKNVFRRKLHSLIRRTKVSRSC